MIIQYHKIALAAAFGLAMAFTLSCSSGSDDTPSGGGGGGQGALFNENSQIYNKDGTRYTGSGIIEATSYIAGSNWAHIRAGSVESGFVNFELNETVPDNEYLSDFLDEDEQRSCTSYPENIKVAAGNTFVLTNNNGNLLGNMFADYEDEQIGERIYYYYFSKPGKIACDLQDDRIYKYDIKATVGWNKIYFRAYRKDGVKIREYSTNDILTKEVKWILQ